MDDATRWDLIHQKNYQEDESHSVYAEEKEKLFPRNCLLVDLGGGTGNDALYFLQKGHSVVLLDVSPFALKVAQDKSNTHNLGNKLITRQVDFGLHLFPVKDNSVDIAYSRIALNYFGSKHTTKIFADIYKMLKVGGVAYLTFKSPDDEAEFEYLQKTGTVYEPNVFIDNGILRSRFTVVQLKTMLTGGGIANFEVNPYLEKVGEKKEEHNPVLHLNEVIIKK